MNKQILICGFVLSILIGLSFVFCDKKDILDNIKVEVQIENPSTVIAIQFINSATGEVIEDDEITLRVEGEDKTKVVDLSGKAQTVYSVMGGFLGIGISKNTIATPENPLRIRFLAEADGYLSSSIPAVIDSTGGESFEMYLVKRSELPTGVTSVIDQSGQCDADGKLNENLQTITPKESETKAGVSISISADTKIKDASGNPLSGQIKTQIIYFNNRSDEALQSFPGGFSVSLSQDRNGSPGGAYFITGGFAAIDITDASGRQARNFEGSAEISIRVPGGTIHPETDLPVQNVDMIGIWSYSSSTGEWKYEQEGILQGPDEDGNFNVSFQTNHLTWWNLDWDYSPFCDDGLLVNIVGKAAGESIKLKLKKKSNNTTIRTLTITDDWIRFYGYVPKGLATVLYGYNSQGNVIGSLEISDLCYQGGFSTLYVNGVVGATRTFHVQGFCPDNPNVLVEPSFPIWFRFEGISTWCYGGVVKNGKITISGLEVPNNYVFKTVYQNTTYTEAFNISANSTVFTPEYSNVVIGEIDGNDVYFNIQLPSGVCSIL